MPTSAQPFTLYEFRALILSLPLPDSCADDLFLPVFCSDSHNHLISGVAPVVPNHLMPEYPDIIWVLVSIRVYYGAEKRFIKPCCRAN